MDKQQARALIKTTFENSFDKNQFVRFIKDFLNSYDQSKAFNQPLTGQYLKVSFRNFISKLDRIGRYKTNKNEIVDILIVYLQKETSIERARSSQRNFVAGYLRGDYGSTVIKDAALTAFISPDKKDWRFSLVKMDHKFEKSKKGNVGVKEEFSPARRWSFLVGEHENSHTAQSQLVNILADTDLNPSLNDLEESFNIEKVTKEFFIKYRELFIRIVEALDRIIEKDKKIKNDFHEKGVNSVDFSKKLLGQIVFLYFLQKKGWFGVPRNEKWGAGSKQFLRELYEKKHSEYQNFFNDILEPLFYEALRIDRRHDDHYYSRFNCKIPFLNGGLFDPIDNYDWVRTDIFLPDDLFSNRNKTPEGDTGDGILDVFDRYNFTVKEDEPLEKDVAIDPELLGKAYEKFNAIRPDNYSEYLKALKGGKKGEESKFNKQFGVYYTPREIVHYMCKQSLINYLYTELNDQSVTHEKFGKDQYSMFGNETKKDQTELTIEHKPNLRVSKEDIEIVIHHGEHFLENEVHIERSGKETETYQYKLPESIRKNAELIDRKLAGIKVCDPAIGSGAFPVGMMSEIVKVRNILSPFIKNQDRSIYQFKRECIENSLYGVDIDPGAVEIAKLRLWLSLVVDEDDIKQIKPLPNLDYKIVCGNSLLGVEKNLFNDKYFQELENIKPLYFNETNPSKKQEYKKQIDDLIHEITNGHSEFDFEVYFSEVFHEKGGFDVILANPPYVVLEKKDFNETYQFIKGNNNTYIAFLEKALMSINVNGIISYIIPTTWLAGNNYKDVRKYLLANRYIQQIIQLPYDVFENAYVDNLILVLTGNKHNNNQVLTFKFKIKEEIRNKIDYNHFLIKDWLNDSE
ncbi:MAG: N-6 DNA methylase, partial [Spirochaetes bacterium]|nr:N-6 DNA methylase [Spirochaetota bacterium]